MHPFSHAICALVLATITTTSSVHALDATAWNYEQPFAIGAPGLTRLELPPETLNVALPLQEDVRLISPSGVETPFVIERETLLPPRSSAVVNFKASLVNGVTLLEFTSPTSDAVNDLRLESPASAFLKSIRVEAAVEGTNWTELVKDTVIFRQASGAEKLSVSLPVGNWKQWRVSIDDQRSEPVPFTGAKIGHVPNPQLTVSQAVALTKVDNSKWRVDLGARNLRLATLNVDLPTPVFARRVSVSYELEEQGVKRSVEMARAQIYRVPGEGGLKMESLAIPVHGAIPASSLVLTIDNGNSPPLEIGGLTATRYPVSLVFFPQEAGQWKLIAGNREARSPAYDLETIQVPLRQGKASGVALGRLMANPSFKEPVALPAVDAKGAAIDLAAWKYRKVISPHRTGVIRLEVDPAVLAHAELSLADLRLIQNGRQIPFLLSPSKGQRSIRPEVIGAADAKRPTVSIWNVTMPRAGLPVASLTADSKTPLFERNFVAAMKQEPPHSARMTHIGSGRWVKSSLNDNSQLAMHIQASRLPETFVLETDNGDNPPIELHDVQVIYDVTEVVAKIVEEAPVHLYYGNRAAGAPRYDLQLLRQELLAASPIIVTVGDEETLKPGTWSESSTPSAGSPLLWIVLAAVVIVLLVIMAKMLPPVEKTE